MEQSHAYTQFLVRCAADGFLLQARTCAPGTAKRAVQIVCAHASIQRGLHPQPPLFTHQLLNPASPHPEAQVLTFFTDCVLVRVGENGVKPELLETLFSTGGNSAAAAAAALTAAATDITNVPPHELRLVPAPPLIDSPAAGTDGPGAWLPQRLWPGRAAESAGWLQGCRGM